MTFQEITARLQTEGITPHAFSVNHFAKLSTLRPKGINEDLSWLGEVHLVARHVDADDGMTLTYYLPEHDLYFQTFGICKWEPQEKDFEAATDDYQEAIIEWCQKYPNESCVWDFMTHYSPVKPISKTVIEYQYAPEMLEA